jgi:hypothetical protein
MILFSTLTSSFVYRFLKRKTIKENKVVPLVVPCNSFVWAQLEKGTTLSNAAVELTERLLISIGEGQKSTENWGNENEGTSGTTQKTDLEKLKEFLVECSGKDGRIPDVEVIKEKLGLSKKQQVKLKKDLHDQGFLYKENERVYKLNIGM